MPEGAGTAAVVVGAVVEVVDTVSAVVDGAFVSVATPVEDGENASVITTAPIVEEGAELGRGKEEEGGSLKIDPDGSEAGVGVYLTVHHISDRPNQTTDSSGLEGYTHTKL